MDNLRTHTFIEFYYRKGNRFLNEHNSKLSFRELNESYGVFNGCETLAREIFNRIKEIDLQNGESRNITLKMKGNHWIDSIEVFVFCDENSHTGASFNPYSEIILCGDRKKFSPLKLTLNLKSSNIVVCLMHELTHAYEDYNRRIKQKKSILQKAYDNGYHLNNSIGNYDNAKKYLSFILYYLNDFEINAHISQIKGELQNCNKHFVNIEQIVDFLRETDVYKRYHIIKNYIDFFSGVTDELSQIIVMSWIEDLSNLKFRSYQNFVKYMNKKYDKLERHMNRFIPKIAYEYLDYGNVLTNFNGDLPEMNV